MQKVSMDSSKLIRISNDTYDRLHSLGSFGDSFDSVIKRLIQNQIQIKKSSDQNA